MIRVYLLMMAIGMGLCVQKLETDENQALIIPLDVQTCHMIKTDLQPGLSQPVMDQPVTNRSPDRCHA
ncbi:hypothetical protein E2K80_16470 [Rhodophyticola sp. CCM32]|uniref:hypothetical protein n=1 Tax=Rhodophyticola sp. CCM32 TaxID=2916397 RepID=UPI00107F5032|nr:hypothetical protein [Rhodophyticola sp. CCM32]QBY02133.1 hypothetical protein E2K80_16470 [Rhodophyticola sp. CCM32]